MLSRQNTVKRWKNEAIWVLTEGYIYFQGIAFQCRQHYPPPPPPEAQWTLEYWILTLFLTIAPISVYCVLCLCIGINLHMHEPTASRSTQTSTACTHLQNLSFFKTHVCLLVKDSFTNLNVSDHPDVGCVTTIFDNILFSAVLPVLVSQLFWFVYLTAYCLQGYLLLSALFFC